MQVKISPPVRDVSGHGELQREDVYRRPHLNLQVLAFGFYFAA